MTMIWSSHLTLTFLYDIGHYLSGALSDFLIKLRLELIPFVSEEKQKEIEELYGKKGV